MRIQFGNVMINMMCMMRGVCCSIENHGYALLSPCFRHPMISETTSPATSDRSAS